MNYEQYLSMRSQAEAVGMTLHPNIERRCVDGVYGMYASGPIAKNEIFASLPQSALMPMDIDFDYPFELTNQLKTIHVIARRMSGLAEPWFYTDSFYPLSFFKEHNVYYCTNEELETLKRGSPLLYKFALAEKKSIARMVDGLLELDPQLDADTLAQVALNYRYRAWGEFGFLPVLDMFNHSDKKGRLLSTKKQNFSFLAGKDYKPGDQIWISYGAKDMYLHAINYGYFDPDADHAIDLGFRVSSVASTPEQITAMKQLSKVLKVKVYPESNRAFEYQLEQGQGMIRFGEVDKSVITYLHHEVSPRLPKSSNKSELGRASRARLLGYVNALTEQNLVHQITESVFPEKLRYMYHMLVKERTILLQTASSLTKN
ncbi:hypothetical protein A3715_01765 [Oleiphilus sp. HI0009]|nr:MULTISPECIES: SET domain-containing protein [unclassified Oleiphilus]KZX77508.1 hypothetical protein A3715_01765 [Oleiphilus sp. HI0009]KZY65533.1 hypothetical protein A3738_08520 [Oleiphilus sp. HI0066]KZY67980.1 hypothetical protein A3739_11310 [Oleiphilus sp. HI0067]